MTRVPAPRILDSPRFHMPLPERADRVIIDDFTQPQPPGAPTDPPLGALMVLDTDAAHLRIDNTFEGDIEIEGLLTLNGPDRAGNAPDRVLGVDDQGDVGYYASTDIATAQLWATVGGPPATEVIPANEANNLQVAAVSFRATGNVVAGTALVTGAPLGTEVQGEVTFHVPGVIATKLTASTARAYRELVTDAQLSTPSLMTATDQGWYPEVGRSIRLYHASAHPSNAAYNNWMVLNWPFRVDSSFAASSIAADGALSVGTTLSVSGRSTTSTIDVQNTTIERCSIYYGSNNAGNIRSNGGDVWNVGNHLIVDSGLTVQTAFVFNKAVNTVTRPAWVLGVLPGEPQNATWFDANLIRTALPPPYGPIGGSIPSAHTSSTPGVWERIEHSLGGWTLPDGRIQIPGGFGGYLSYTIVVSMTGNTPLRNAPAVQLTVNGAPITTPSGGPFWSRLPFGDDVNGVTVVQSLWGTWTGLWPDGTILDAQLRQDTGGGGFVRVEPGNFWIGGQAIPTVLFDVGDDTQPTTLPELPGVTLPEVDQPDTDNDDDATTLPA